MGVGRTATARTERVARRAARSGSGPTGEHAVPRFPAASAAFALFGEVLMIGLLVTLVSLPVVTLPAALAAATRHLRRHLRARDSRLALFWIDVRAGLLGGIGVGVAALALTLILLLDIDLARSGMLPGGAIVEAVGWMGLGATALTLLAAASRWEPQSGWRAALRAVPGVLRGDVRGALYLLAACVFVVVATWALPPLIVAGLGCAVLAVVAVPERPRRRLRARTEAERRFSD